MPTEKNQLKSLQEVLVEQLKTDERLAALNIIPEDKHDLATTISTALSQLGLCLVVQTVSAGISNPNLSTPMFDSIAFAVEVWENKLLNQELDAMSTAVAVVDALYHFRPVGVAVFGGMMINPAPATLTPIPHPDLVGLAVNFTLGKS